jgi:hypothetical protein
MRVKENGKIRPVIFLPPVAVRPNHSYSPHNFSSSIFSRKHYAEHTIFIKKKKHNLQLDDTQGERHLTRPLTGTEV